MHFSDSQHWPRSIPAKIGNGGTNRIRSGFTLLETLGVVLILSMLTALVVSWPLKWITQHRRQSEIHRLESFEEAIRHQIMSRKQLPGTMDWAQRVAEASNHTLQEVTHNSTDQPRFWVMDPSFISDQLPQTTHQHPYDIPIHGLASRPKSPRVLLLSTLGTPPPASFLDTITAAEGVDAAWFDAIWGQESRELAASWPEWKPNQYDDLCIHRMNLGDMFVPLVLNNISPQSGFYAIESAEHTGQPLPFPEAQRQELPSTPLIEGDLVTTPLYGTSQTSYHLRGTLIEFYHHDQGTFIPFAHDVLKKPSSFFYEANRWRAHFEGVEIQYPEGNNLEKVAELFVNVPTNPRVDDLVQVGLTDITNQLTYDYILLFFQQYLAWAEDGFPAINPTATLPSTANALEAMIGELLDLQDAGKN